RHRAGLYCSTSALSRCRLGRDIAPPDRRLSVLLKSIRDLIALTIGDHGADLLADLLGNCAFPDFPHLHDARSFPCAGVKIHRNRKVTWRVLGIPAYMFSFLPLFPVDPKFPRWAEDCADWRNQLQQFGYFLDFQHSSDSVQTGRTPPCIARSIDAAR